jgi:hypothetical protein
MQNKENNSSRYGGFYLAEVDLKLARHKLKRLYSWATMFAIHAMTLANDASERKIEGSQLW